MSNIQISDFIGSYPETSDPLFNTKITRKQEFRELTPEATEKIPKRGEGFKHQKFAVRYITWYDKLLLVHDPGTGKSCIMVHSAELFKNEYFKSPNDPTKIKRAILLVSGPTLVTNIKNEIVCKCTDNIYITEMVRRSPDETRMKAAITREIKTWYDVMTYTSFANKIKKDFGDNQEALDNFMSNKVIYIDEAHNITKKDDLDKLKAGTLFTSSVKDESIYETIYRAFHSGKRNKFILATATPMINSSVDIIPLMNVILPLDMQLPNLSAEQLSTLTLEQLEPYFRSKLSYIRKLDTGAIQEEMGTSPEGLEIKIFPIDMSKFQYKSYIHAKGDTDESFRNHQRHSSNFVFPDGSFGTLGFNKYINRMAVKYFDTVRGNLVEKNKYRYEIRNDENGNILKQYLMTEDGLSTLSNKYSTIVELCKSAYPDTEVITDDKGIIFVYFPDYVRGSGAIMLAKCLEAQGYEEFRESKDIFFSTNLQQRNYGPCTTSMENKTERDHRIHKRKRFVLLSSDTPDIEISVIFNTLNSYENRYGEFIQVIIGSRIAGEGININNAVAMIMASGSWNYSRYIQARDRVFRSTSHEMRMEDVKKRLIDENQDPRSAKFYVKTYNMASIYEGDPDAIEPIMREDNVNTVDTYMYDLSEKKDRVIRHIVRLMKQSSVDCFINYNRNVRSTDVEGSPECDYTICEYGCAGIDLALVNDIDRTTKILYYSTEEVNDALNIIKGLFSTYYSLKITQIYSLIPNADKIYIDMALEKLIRENIRIVDRMGFYGYLRESPDGVIYLEKDQFELRHQPENTVYTSVLIGTQDPSNNTFADYVMSLRVLEEEFIVSELIKMTPANPNFLSLLGSLSLISKVILLEYVLYQYMDGKTSDLVKAIMSAFLNNIYEMKEPSTLLRVWAQRVSSRGQGRGRKPTSTTIPKMKKLGLLQDIASFVIDPNEPGERIIMHTLLNQSTHDRTNYGATSRFFKAEGRLRILKLSEGIRWRNPNVYENIVYNYIIQIQTNEIRNYYERFPIYGIMLPPENMLHIRDREGEDPQAAHLDARAINDGRVCGTWSTSKLIDIVYRLGIPINDSTIEQVSRQEMIEFLSEQNIDTITSPITDFSNEKLRHFYVWYKLAFSKSDICGFIKQYFERTGRLFTGKMPVEQMKETGSVGTIQTSQQITTPDYSEGVLLSDLIQTPFSPTVEEELIITPSQPSTISSPLNVPALNILSPQGLPTSPIVQQMAQPSTYYA